VHGPHHGLGEKHLLRTVREYQTYYNESRTYSSLDGNSPSPRVVRASGEIISTPVLGGLHHRYSRSAWNSSQNLSFNHPSERSARVPSRHPGHRLECGLFAAMEEPYGEFGRDKGK